MLTSSSRALFQREHAHDFDFHIPEKVNGKWEHVFGNIKLSYSEDDSAFKTRLVDFLNKHGIEPVALQKTTDAKSLGENMIQEKEAIDQCYALIVVISKNYVRSEAISIGESEYAILHSKMVVPIMVPNTNAKLTYDDASTNRAWENWKQLEGFCIRADTGDKILTEEQMFEILLAKLHDEKYLAKMRIFRDKKIRETRRINMKKKKRRARQRKRQKNSNKVLEQQFHRQQKSQQILDDYPNNKQFKQQAKNFQRMKRTKKKWENILLMLICFSVLGILFVLTYFYLQNSKIISNKQESIDELQERVRPQRHQALNATDKLRSDAVRANLQNANHSRSMLKIFDSRLLHGDVKDDHYLWALWRVGAEHAFYETHSQQLVSRIARLCALADASASGGTHVAPNLQSVCCGRPTEYPGVCGVSIPSSTCTPTALARVGKGAARSSKYSFGPPQAQRHTYALDCQSAPARLVYTRDATPRTRFLSSTFERVPAVELKEQAENSQGIVADKCTVCRQTDACAAVATKEWCERRCQTEHTCTGFYVTDDGGCCIVKSRPQGCRKTTNLVTTPCRYYERKGVSRNMDGTERVFVYPNLEPGQSLEVKVWDHSMPVLLQAFLTEGSTSGCSIRNLTRATCRASESMHGEPNRKPVLVLVSNSGSTNSDVNMVVAAENGFGRGNFSLFWRVLDPEADVVQRCRHHRAVGGFGDRQCDAEMNTRFCDWDGGDCMCASRRGFLSDGSCDDKNDLFVDTHLVSRACAWDGGDCTPDRTHRDASQDTRKAERNGTTWQLSWTDGTDDFVITFDTATESFRYSNGVAQRDFETLSFQSNVVRSMKVNEHAIAVVNVQDVPPNWQCVEAWYNDGECDCGCGAVDRDCLLLTLVGEDAGVWDWSASCDGTDCCIPTVQHCVHPQDPKAPEHACARYVRRDTFTDRVISKTQSRCDHESPKGVKQTANQRGCVF